MLDSLDAATVRRWCGCGLAALRAHQNEIDELNVYPVPDGDTGTNLVLTLTSAHQALALDLDVSSERPAGGADGADGAAPLGDALRLMARGALLGARGNSGVIVSQILRGLADGLAGAPVVRGRHLAAALRSATTAAYAAVAQPVEGTVLSVLAAAADGASRVASDDLVAVARAASGAAAEALARTPQQLPVLARAGVVDAGGRGLCLLLDALVEVLSGVPVPDRPAPPPASPGAAAAGAVAREGGSTEFGYEVQYLLDADDTAVRQLRQRLAALGDSLVVVGTGDGTWNVHVHVNDVGAAIEAGVVAGRPHRIAVTRFADQAAGCAPAERPADPRARAAVVMAAGDGLATLFAGEGATVVGANPSPAELLDGIRATGAGQVVLLPGDPNTQAVAAAAAAEAATLGIRVSVVPTRSPVQALAALAVRDPARAFPDDVIAMAEAAGACRYGEVCYASREALTVAGRCRAGDVLALVDGEVNLIGTDLTRVCLDLVDRMLGGGGELVTVLLGAGAPPDLDAALAEHVAQVWPFAEVQSYPGGQPFYPMVMGVE